MTIRTSFHVGDVVRTHGGRTPWRIDSIGRGSSYYFRNRDVYRCVSLRSNRRQEFPLTTPLIELWSGPLPEDEAKSLIVRGHGLQHEGGPFNADGTYANLSGWNHSGEGRALCSCGEMSDALPSAASRKRWHRAHKISVLAKQPAA